MAKRRDSNTPLLELIEVSKAFSGVPALSEVSLRVEAGEVHGLLGQNGSGKSTLLKVLAGFHTPDEGRLRIRGEELRLPLHPGTFRDLGVAFVHQDLALSPELSVTENMIVAEIVASKPRLVRWRREHRRIANLLRSYDLTDIDVTKPVEQLSQMQRALVAIVRAVEDLHEDAGRQALLVLDEPTAFLPREGVEQLVALIRGIAKGGGSVLFVTHDIDEAMEVCDRVTVLRNGRNAGSADTSESSATDLVELIVGRKLDPYLRTDAAPQVAGTALSVAAASGKVLRDVTLDVHGGEVVGVTGLVGSGFDEVPHILFGSRPGSGSLEVDGRTVDLATHTPRGAIRMGMALIPADRRAESAVGALSVTDNVTVTTLDRHRSRGALSRRRMRVAAGEVCHRFDVKPNRPGLPLESLSGGNQQKAILGKWLQDDPRILLLDQPTQGVDVGARAEIFAAVREAALQGAAVVCASTDAEELAAVCDRVIVMDRGRIVRELSGGALGKEQITQAVMTSTEISWAVTDVQSIGMKET